MGTVKQYQKVIAKAGIAGKLLSPLDAVSVMAGIAQKTLTAAQVKALNATPITLIAAPGADRYTHIDAITVALDYSGAVFTGANAIEIRETNAAGTKVSADISAAFLNSGADAICEVTGIEAQTTRILNAAIVARVPTADPGGASATSTLTFTIHYRTIKPY